MDFKIDENLPDELSDLLKERGHAACTVLEQKLGGRPDTEIIDVCLGEKRALITLDWDFSDIRQYPPEKYAGIILLKPQSQSKTRILSLLKQCMPLLDAEPITGQLLILEPGRLRIHEPSGA